MNTEKILIVDDDLNICELLRLYLTKEKYDVVIANDGISAVSMFQEERPSLVLLDIMLPKLDGWQVCREIRKTSYPSIPGSIRSRRIKSGLNSLKACNAASPSFTIFVS